MDEFDAEFQHLIKNLTPPPIGDFCTHEIFSANSSLTMLLSYFNDILLSYHENEDIELSDLAMRFIRELNGLAAALVEELDKSYDDEEDDDDFDGDDEG